MTTLLAIDALIFNPDTYLPPFILALTVLGIVSEIAQQLAAVASQRTGRNK